MAATSFPAQPYHWKSRKDREKREEAG